MKSLFFAKIQGIEEKMTLLRVFYRFFLKKAEI